MTSVSIKGAKNGSAGNNLFVNADGSIPTRPQSEGEDVDTQNPLSFNGDSLYAKDIKISLSDGGTFTATDSDLLSLFNNLDDGLEDTSATNPKFFELLLERPMTTGLIGLVTHTGNFSNVKIILKNRQDVIIKTIDDSSNSTKYTNHGYLISPPTDFCCIRVEFHTTDTINIGFIRTQKEDRVVARIQGERSDGDLGTLGLTNGNNAKISIEEFESGVSSNSNTQLNVTQYLSDGTEGTKLNMDGTDISVQHPLPTDGDSLYVKDIDTTNSTSSGFTGSVSDLFDNVTSTIVNSNATNPKEILVKIKRPIDTATFKFCANTGDFSNVKIIMKDAAGTVVSTIDDSSNNTKYTSNEYVTTPSAFCQVLIQFHTADTVSMSFVSVQKAVHTHSQLLALKPDGTTTFIDATTGGNLKISVEEIDSGAVATSNFFLEVAKGDITGHSFISKFGQNSDIGTGAYEDIWDGGGTYTWPSDGTAPITHIYSTIAETQDIEVQGLDINGDQVTQTITLTGTTVAPLTTALWRIFRMKNVGTVDNAGTIHASDSGKVVSYAQMAPGNNQTLMALYTIPNGKTAYMYRGGASIVGTNRAYSIDGKMCMREYGGVCQLKHTFGASTDGSSTFQHEYPFPLPISGKTDIIVSAISSASGGVLNTTFDLLLVDN